MIKGAALLVCALTTLLILGACGADDKEPTKLPTTVTELPPIVTEEPTTPPPTTPPPPPDTPTTPPNGALTIGSVGETLEFDTTELTASAGAEVVLRLKNNSTVLQHNWVLVESGTKDAVASDGLKYPDDDYIKPGDDRVVASVKLIDQGEMGEVRFIAPAAGTYQFVCTFPAHNFTMFGTFEVTP